MTDYKGWPAEAVKRTRELEAACAAKDAEIRTLRNASAGLLEVVEAAKLLFDEINMAMPSYPQEFNAENIWRAAEKFEKALAALGGGDAK